MEHIKIFLDKLLKWEANYKIYDYDEDKYECEIAELYQIGFKSYRSIDNNHIEYIRNKWKNKFRAENFELQHPIVNSIKTRAVASLPYWNATVKGNYVFMIDEEHRFPWIFLQAYNAFDVLITQQGIFIRNIEENIKKDNFIRLKYLSRDIEKIKQMDLQFKKATFKCLLNSPRPYHYFMEDLPSLIFLECINVSIRSFYFPKNCIKIEESAVDIYPNIFAYLPNFHSKLVSNAFQHIIKESLTENLKIQNKKYELVIWLSFPSEIRRKWFNFKQSVIVLLKNLSLYFNKILIYFDGITSFDGEIVKNDYNESIFNNIKNAMWQLNKIECDFVSLIGLDYRTKIFYCRQIDFALVELGTSVMVPGYILNKPIVGYFGSSDFIAKIRRKIEILKITKIEYIKTVNYKNNLCFDYYISENHIYNLTAEVLEELSAAGKLKIKNLKMHRLEVPPVELIAKQYELEQKLGIKLPIESVALYTELEKQINTLALNNNTLSDQLIKNIEAMKHESFSTFQTILNQEKQKLQLQQRLEQDFNNQLKIKNAWIDEKNNLIEEKDYFINQLIFEKKYKTAKERIQNHLAYKLGTALIENSKSVFGYIRMPFVLSYIRDKHKLEQKRYEENIKKYPELILPPLESYADYNEALKEKECFTYKLGLALMRADREWYKGGYIRFYFESRRMKKEFLKRKEYE